MTRYIVVGNGDMLACLDKDYRIRDFFYPYVGQENHVSGHHHRIGVWVENKFSWVDSNSWNLSIGYKQDSLVSEAIAVNEGLEVRLTINDGVHFEKNVFLRKVKVENLSSREREIRVFFSQHFHINEANIGDTVYYNPELNSIVNYKGQRYFLIGGRTNGNDFTDYSTGSSNDVQQKRGTYVDCEDGVLSKNSVEHGSVDSAIGFSMTLDPGASQNIYYWIAVGKDYSEVKDLRSFILEQGAGDLLEKTEKQGVSWIAKGKIDFHDLDDGITNLFKRSLLILRTQIDNRGAIIAANDSDTLKTKKDTYSYMWPRDGALVARSLDRTGHHGVTNRFFDFCAKVAKDGYLMHKYRPDGSLGSSWHSWMKEGQIQLPVQEDETALVLDALWKNYNESKDDKLIKGIKDFIKKAGDFLVDFRDEETKLPKESYDLWEEKLGVHTFTACTVFAGLNAAQNFAEKFGRKTDAKKYAKAAIEVREAILENLYNKHMDIFVKGVFFKEGNKQFDNTIDSSTAYGLFEYKVLDINDPRLVRTVEKTIEKLWNNSGVGGLGRYENDNYYRIPGYGGNPWIVCTMWLAEYYVIKAEKLEDLNKAKNLLSWAVKVAIPSGALSEQISAQDGQPLSVSPLTWSHAGFIIAIIKYLDKYEELEKAK